MNKNPYAKVNHTFMHLPLIMLLLLMLKVIYVLLNNNIILSILFFIYIILLISIIKKIKTGADDSLILKLIYVLGLTLSIPMHFLPTLFIIYAPIYSVSSLTIYCIYALKKIPNNEENSKWIYSRYFLYFFVVLGTINSICFPLFVIAHEI